MPAPHAEPARLPPSARLGTIGGVAGWAISASLVCLAAGELATFARVVLPSLIVSLGVGAACIVAIERLRSRHGERSTATRWATVGVLLCALALLLALARGWTMPHLLASERVRGVLGATRSATAVPAAAVLACAVGGLACLARAAFSGRRSARP